MHVLLDIVGRTLVWLALQSPADAPVTAAADSLPPTPALTDSTASAALVDSLPSSALPDTTMAAVEDSLATATTAADSTQEATVPEVAPVPPPWVGTAPLGAREFAEFHPGLLAEALELVPDVALRVAGDWGAPAFLSLGPLGGPAPEMLYDGVPTRSPADLDPGVFDRSAISLVSLGVAGADAAPGGPPRLLAETLPPLVGRTHMRTHFTKEPHESYLRGLWLTTPASPRVLRFEFEEWKTEDGRNFTTNPQYDALPDDFGRSKMRRFRVGGEAATGLGRVSLSFGRGRRLYRGTVLSTADTERWTGEVTAGLDRAGEAGWWRLRGYHLDFSDDDDVHAEIRDATRLGMRLERVPLDHGPGMNVQVERWSARFVSGAQERRPQPAYVARVAGSWKVRSTETSAWTAFAEGVYAEHAIGHFDAAGGARFEQGRDRLHWQVGAERRLRLPTLLETSGLLSMDVADGTRLLREGSGPLPPERQDRAHLTLAADAPRWSVTATAETWRLTRGIGFDPQGTVAPAVGDLELTVHQVLGSASLRGGGVAQGWWLSVWGHHVLGPLSHARDRGTGWPLWSVQARARAWRHVSSRQNRGYLEMTVHSTGPRFDDTQAFLRGTQLTTQTRLDARVGLKIRDAELYLAWRNLLDAELVEVSGTLRRSREVRLGLVWPFFN